MWLALAMFLAPAPRVDAVAPTSPRVEAPRRFEGVVVLTAGALAGAAGLGLGLASAQQVAAVDRCVECPPRLPAMALAAVALNTTSLGLLTLGAGVRGRVCGSRSPSRAGAAPWISVGGLTTTGGLLFVAAGLGWQFAESSRASATPWTLLQIGLSSVVAGSSLLVYGLAYRKYAPDRELRVDVVPTAARGHLGLALVGRF
ncbi:hypothetical protein [Nannocystis pusilla]|uniref:Uncharacterized protein n=1 Tax=Nannocystis pusilla TaxID=889268 RepID=A0ABS7TIS5_9BACT|nr:hypothetical protein [Nannocystis pusilla]MBZ5708126.1 hypothetical protein [Nannocystis pusilla]